MYFILMSKAHPEAEWEPDFSITFPTPIEATAQAKRYNEDAVKYGWRARYKVRKVVDTDDDNFIAREAALNLTPVPWETRTTSSGWAWMLPHIDPDNDRQVRFFRHVEDAVSQKYTSMLMSRFLSNFEDIEGDEAQEILIKHGFYKDQVFGITNDPDKIIDIYSNGPTSCMNDPDDYELPEPHPAIVYSEGDFAVAYIGTEGSYSARAVVCKTLKKFYTIYGHDTLMKQHLETEGYTYSSPYHNDDYVGMRVKYILKDGYPLMPYNDFAEYGNTSECGNFIHLSDNHGDYYIRTTSGWAESED